MWKILVRIDSYGAVSEVQVFNGHKLACRSAQWTDRSTLNDVLVWANRSTACDADLRARHIVLNTG